VVHGITAPVILVGRDFTPSLTVQLDPSRVLGLATDAGTRTSHSAILARALGIPAVVGLSDLAKNRGVRR
jgi:phosphoenolpyruvate-protein phosphotransferase (PTS system enzyme I)